MRPSYIFLGGEGAASFVFARPRRKAGARHVVPGRSRRARRACPCRPDAGRAIFSRRPRAQGNVLHRGGEADRPPRAPRGGVRGGVGCARGAEVFCASAWSWLSMLCLLCDRARCDDRRKESPRPEKPKATEPPAPPAWGVWGALECESAGGGVREREPPPTPRTLERETEEGGGICAAASGGYDRNHNRTCPIMSRIMGQAARHRPHEPGPSAQHSGLCLRGIEAPEGGRLPLSSSVHRQAVSGRKDSRRGDEIYPGAQQYQRNSENQCFNYIDFGHRDSPAFLRFSATSQ